MKLAPNQETYLNLKRAIESFEAAVKKKAYRNFKEHYLQTVNNLASSYYQLAEVTDSLKFYQKAIRFYHEAGKINSPRQFPLQYATAQINLGNAYFALTKGQRADARYDRENCQKTIFTLEEALKYQINETAPSSTQALALNNLGCACYIMATGEPMGNNKIIQLAYRELLKVRKFEQIPPRYAYAQYNYHLETGHPSVTGLEDKANYCKRAVETLQEALKIYNQTEFPIEYATVQNNLGNAYFRLTEIDYQSKNFKYAIEAYQQALIVWSPELLPILSANTYNNLGNAYLKLAKIEDQVGNCQKAAQAFEKTLEVYILKQYPLNFAIAQDNLKTAYSMISELENSLEIYKQTFQACEAALKVFTKRRFPKKYRLLKYEVDNLVKLLIYQ